MWLMTPENGKAFLAQAFKHMVELLMVADSLTLMWRHCYACIAVVLSVDFICWWYVSRISRSRRHSYVPYQLVLICFVLWCDYCCPYPVTLPHYHAWKPAKNEMPNTKSIDNQYIKYTEIHYGYSLRITTYYWTTKYTEYFGHEKAVSVCNGLNWYFALWYISVGMVYIIIDIINLAISANIIYDRLE